MKSFIRFLPLIALSASAAGVDRAEALASNAQELFNMLVHIFHSLVWILAVIPALLLGWATSHTMKKYKHYIDGKMEQKNTILEHMSGIALNGVFALSGVFIIYGIFVKTYADPSGSMSFFEIWNQLVVSFWREAISNVAH
ncbi:MAG: hypothetical protein PHT07_10645 [Paludibacter sp.]|nr:hypothetical protein [Paludibacter sp.]